MTPKQRNTNILDINNIEIFYLPFWTRYKEYRNPVSALLKRSKTNHYNHYFDINWNNIENTWKGINSIFSIKPDPSDIPEILNTRDSTITNPVEIANVFNNCFSSFASQTKESIKYFHKQFLDFLKNRAQNSCFKSYWQRWNSSHHIFTWFY